MKVFYSKLHELHAPQYEFFRGDKVPCFEKPERAWNVLEEVRSQGHTVLEPSVDSSSVLTQVHTDRYIHFLQTAWEQWIALDPTNASRQPFPSVWPIRSLRNDPEPDNFIAKYGLYSMDNGTPLVAGTWQAVKSASDCVVSAVKEISAGDRSVFCATRPPGHHAGKDFMGGYCFLNNAAIAAQEFLNSGARHVAILDVDYHHGNGTQSIFYDRADVLYVSIHADPRIEYPFYLGYADETGQGAGLGCNLNLPLAGGTPSSLWFDALEKGCSAIDGYKADALVISLGLDTFGGDPLTKFNLSSEDFIKLGNRIAMLNKPTVFILEGGYASTMLGVNACNVLEGFGH